MSADPTERVFRGLANEWEHDTGHLSSIQAKVRHPAYQQIIALGPAVLPFILRELKRRRGHWFYALRTITGEDPAAGAVTVRSARALWLRWGHDHGYLGRFAA